MAIGGEDVCVEERIGHIVCQFILDFIFLLITRKWGKIRKYDKQQNCRGDSPLQIACSYHNQIPNRIRVTEKIRLTCPFWATRIIFVW